MSVHQLLPITDVNYFALMGRLAAENGAVNLAQGFPNFDGPEILREKLAAAVAGGQNQYSGATGLQSLRRAVCVARSSRFGVDYDPETEVTITNGCAGALNAVLMGLLNGGDGVVAMEPFYDLYPEIVGACGGTFHPVSMRVDRTGYRIDLDRLEAALALPSVRFLILNSPHNPTGAVITADELAAIAALCVRRNITVISDEAYESLCYDALPFRSPSQHPALRPQTVVVSSASKTLSITGWRIGWAFAPATLTRKIAGAQSRLSICSPVPLQAAVAEALSWCEASGFFPDLARIYQQKRDVLVRGMRRAGFQTLAPEGAFFCIFRPEEAIARNSVEFCQALVRDAGVAALPMRPFCTPQGPWDSYARLVFCKTDAMLDDACQRLAAWHARQPKARAEA